MKDQIIYKFNYSGWTVLFNGNKKYVHLIVTFLIFHYDDNQLSFNYTYYWIVIKSNSYNTLWYAINRNKNHQSKTGQVGEN